MHRKQQQNDDRGDDHRQVRVLPEQRFEHGDGFQTLDCRGNRDGGGKHRIRKERGAAEHRGDRQPAAILTNQRIQGEDTTFAFVVDAHGNQHIFDGGNQGD